MGAKHSPSGGAPAAPSPEGTAGPGARPVSGPAAPAVTRRCRRRAVPPGRPAGRRRRSRRAPIPPHRSLLAPAAARLRRGREHAAGQARERQALQPDVARAGHLGEEHALAAEQRRLDLADVLDLEVDRGRVRDEAAGIDQHRLARLQLAAHDRPAGVDEGQAVALQALHDEALAAEEADRQPLLEVQADRHAARRAQEGLLLRDQRAAELAQVDRHDLAGERRGEGDAALDVGLVHVDGGEHLLAGDEPLAGAHQRAPEARVLLRAVAEYRVHRDARLHEHHGAGLADRRLAGIELDLHELHLGALDLVVHHVHGHRLLPRVRVNVEVAHFAPAGPRINPCTPRI